jgi:two-component system sensor histidine kinase KdpD
MREDRRPDPESFLDQVDQSESTPHKGKLKVYVGAAAGVGKTYKMLDEAHDLKQQGRDVVIGIIETHGRAETAARVAGLETIPLREIPYNNVVLKEMDLDPLLARKPEFAIVDELAHTNAPGSRHHKRYQDVEDLLAAGINVITALNVQHLESLRPVVKRLTGIEVRETLPDTFLAHADQIVTVDIPVELLRQRLREGKIYPPDRVEAALRNFFKHSNLEALRELALREVARGLSRQREDREALRVEGGRRPATTDRIMVCLSTNPHGGGELLRKASREAGQLNAEWFAVHVETPSESIQKVSTTDFRVLLENVNLASDLGAEVVWLKSPEVLQAMLDFARDKRITKIIVGRTRPRLVSRLLGKSLTHELIAKARDFDIEVLAESKEEEAP